MLEFMRRKTQSFAVYLVLGIIITTFVISFGPAASKVSCGSSPVLASFDGDDITMLDWKYARALTRYFINDSSGVDYVRFAMDKIIERKMLVKLASENNIRFVRKDAENMILNNRVILFGNEIKLSSIGAWPINPATKKPALFNYEQFKNWVKSQIGLQNENQFLDIQAEEMMAKAYKDTFLYTNASSNNAKWVNYQVNALEMTFKVASFSPVSYKNKISVTDKEINDFLSNKDNKKKIEDIYKANSKKYSKLPEEKQVDSISFVVDGLFNDIKTLKQKDLNTIIVKFPKYTKQIKKIQTFLKNNANGIVLDGTVPPEDYKVLGWIKQDDVNIDKNLNKAIFETKEHSFSKPIFYEKGIRFVYVKAKKGGKLSKSASLRIIAKDMLLTDKAEKLALKDANNALEQLKKGVKPEEISNMPEFLVEGPVNPLQGREGLLDRKLATEIWKLNKPGIPLGRIITTGAGKDVKYNIYMLDAKNLPSKQDFEELTKENSTALVNSRSHAAFDINIKDLCRRKVKSGKLEIGNQLHSILTYKKPTKIDSKDKNKKFPAANYSPCQFIGTSLNF